MSNPFYGHKFSLFPEKDFPSTLGSTGTSLVSYWATYIEVVLALQEERKK